jgi:glycosyltransferase involved in cell wall biosynthesis
MPIHNILVDAREFVTHKKTGIGRFLEGLLDALTQNYSDIEIILATYCKSAVPDKLRDKKKLITREVPTSFISSEKALSDLAKEGAKLFLSPYPKLPLFGTGCASINTVHDVQYLTHPAYKKRFNTFVGRFRLQKALKRSSLTWYDSSWSLRETEKYVGYIGKNAKVRHLAIDERFRPSETEKDDDVVLDKYQLQSGYIIVIGNGLPHKNLGVLLGVAKELARNLVLLGVSEENRKYWQSRYPDAQSTWIEYIDDEELPALIRGAFCLAQPSTAEGYGYPPLEAMASGTPSVISNIPVLIETTGGHSLAADPSDSKMWIKAFQALEEKGFYQTQVEKGLTWVAPLRGQKGWRKHVADIEELLKGL